MEIYWYTGDQYICYETTDSDADTDNVYYLSMTNILL